uniref:DUF4220 domain-containing protein n=2 Tax=Aegilops tauschii TaxID=37682 RepID=A0A453DDP4_AEGTS
SWSADDKRLLAATILLFILVIIRSFQKALDLKSSSFDALRQASLSEMRVVLGSSDTQEGRLDNFIRKAREVRQGSSEDQGFPALPYQLFLDFPSSYAHRVEILSKFWRLEPKSAYQAIESVLSDMTSFLYTKDDSAFPAMTSSFRTPNHTLKNVSRMVIFRRRCTLALAYTTVITAICLVHKSSHRKARGGEDTWVTLVMLYGTLVLELVYLGVQTALRDKFSGRILQHSLIGLLTDNIWWCYKFRAFGLGKVAELLQCKDSMDQYLTYMGSSYLCEDITELVRQHVESGWKDIHDNETYRKFNDARGEWTLRRKKCLPQLGWSLQRPFDETIILWHLATDICLRSKAMSPGDMECARQCEVISNYMMHLLFANPEMLMPGSRKSLVTKASDEVKNILSKSRNEMEFIGTKTGKCNEGSAPDLFIHDASVLARSLSGDELDDHGQVTSKWEVIQGVWVEMLCFSAGRCRGYLHAQALGTGVEYLSYVWVLLAYTGMETFPEKLQRREGQTVDGESSLHGGREDPAATTTSAFEIEDWAHAALDV